VVKLGQRTRGPQKMKRPGPGVSPETKKGDKFKRGAPMGNPGKGVEKVRKIYRGRNQKAGKSESQ